VDLIKKILKTIAIALFAIALLFVAITTTCIHVGNEPLLLHMLKESAGSMHKSTKSAYKEITYTESELDSLQAVMDSLFGSSWVAAQSFNGGIYFLDTITIRRIDDTIVEFRYGAMFSDTLVVGNSIKYNINTLWFDSVNKKIAPIRADFFSISNKPIGAIDKPDTTFGVFFEKQTEVAVYKILERVIGPKQQKEKI